MHPLMSLRCCPWFGSCKQEANRFVNKSARQVVPSPDDAGSKVTLSCKSACNRKHAPRERDADRARDRGNIEQVGRSRLVAEEEANEQQDGTGKGQKNNTAHKAAYNDVVVVSAQSQADLMGKATGADRAADHAVLSSAQRQADLEDGAVERETGFSVADPDAIDTGSFALASFSIDSLSMSSDDSDILDITWVCDKPAQTIVSHQELAGGTGCLRCSVMILPPSRSMNGQWLLDPSCAVGVEGLPTRLKIHGNTVTAVLSGELVGTMSRHGSDLLLFSTKVFLVSHDELSVGPLRFHREDMFHQHVQLQNRAHFPGSENRIRFAEHSEDKRDAGTQTDCWIGQDTWIRCPSRRGAICCLQCAGMAPLSLASLDQGVLNGAWKCPLNDSVVCRFYNRWVLIDGCWWLVNGEGSKVRLHSFPLQLRGECLTLHGPKPLTFLKCSVVDRTDQIMQHEAPGLPGSRSSHWSREPITGHWKILDGLRLKSSPRLHRLRIYKTYALDADGRNLHVSCLNREVRLHEQLIWRQADKLCLLTQRGLLLFYAAV
eukprot:TRINITY_DN8715_c0_g3_i1.p1 TRINITY_DN8715_c0_g3~~TRINITY_DN8715_c0_g3_i1.p1  ORF type:complete len:546 (-),score=58.78 TRINITY_DN8715_c0_g3_i1:207-1844(-)